MFVKADEIARDLEVSKAMAYRLIRKWNQELDAKGFTTIQGRVSRKYYLEQLYGMAGEDRKECG